MAWHKPYDSDEIAYIRAQWGRMSAGEIAEKLGRSKRGVNNKAKELGLAASAASPTAAVIPAQRLEEQAAGDEMLDDLLELKGLVRAQLLDAGPQSLAKLSAEYREVLEAIDRRKAGDAGNASAATDVGQLLISFGVSRPDPARGPAESS